MACEKEQNEGTLSCFDRRWAASNRHIIMVEGRIPLWNAYHNSVFYRTLVGSWSPVTILCSTNRQLGAPNVDISSQVSIWHSTSAIWHIISFNTHWQTNLSISTPISNLMVMLTSKIVASGAIKSKNRIASSRCQRGLLVARIYWYGIYIITKKMSCRLHFSAVH